MSAFKSTIFRYASTKIRSIRSARILPSSRGYSKLENYDLDDMTRVPHKQQQHHQQQHQNQHPATSRPDQSFLALLSKGFRDVKEIVKPAYMPSRRYEKGDNIVYFTMGFTYRLG